ncbi:MAG: HPr kinase/phosphorylase [Pseudooceanicola sp.]
MRLHASCVAWDGRGLLILGASGRGKSALALELMARGARLVADDQVVLAREGAAVVASSPPAIAGRIEARFVGILAAEALDRAELALVVDLDLIEDQRLPPQRSRKLLGLPLPLLHNVEKPHFPAAVLQYLKQDRVS